MAEVQKILHAYCTSPYVLTFAEGAIIGALTIAASFVIAWRQRVIQVRDRAAERREVAALELTRQDREAKVARREKWQPEYEAILKHLDCGETLAYSVILNGPCTTSELGEFGIAAFRVNSEILAGRGIEHLHLQLLAIARQVDDLVFNAVPPRTPQIDADERDNVVDHSQRTNPLRLAVLQDRAAHHLVDLIKAARQTLRTEWGD